MASAGSSRAAKMPLCLTCGDKGELKQLIYCGKCKDVAVHRYCLAKFSPGNENIYWLCWECEPKIDVRKAEVYTGRLERNCFQRNNMSRRVVRANQGALEEIRESNPNCILESKEKGDPITKTCFLLHDESEDLYPLKFSRKVYQNDSTVDSKKKFQVIDLNKRKKRIQNSRRVILDDSSDSDKDGRRCSKDDGDHVLKCIDGRYSKKDSKDQLGIKLNGDLTMRCRDESEEFWSYKSNQKVYKDRLFVDSVQNARTMDLKRRKKCLINRRRIILDDSSDSSDERQQNRKQRRMLILDEGGPFEEVGVQMLDCIDEGEKSCPKASKNGLFVECVKYVNASILKKEREHVSTPRNSVPINSRKQSNEKCQQGVKQKGRLLSDGSNSLNLDIVDGAEDGKSSSNKIQFNEEPSISSLNLRVVGASKQRKLETRKCDITLLAKTSLVSEERLKGGNMLDRDIGFLEVGDCNIGVVSLACQQDIIQSSTSYDQMYENKLSFIGAQPMRCPIWRGCISVMSKKDRVDIGIMAHLSNKASPKVFHAAVVLPSSIIVDVQSKDKLWPSSFRRSSPKDNCIALFLLPECERDDEVLQVMLDSMHKNNLALKTNVMQNVELLIFSSSELPQPYWKFGSKYYLWGVFMDKRFSHMTSTFS